MRFALCVCLIAGVVSISSVAGAEPESLLRGWSAPPECIQEEELLGAVEAQRSREMEERSVRGQVERRDGGWVAALTVYEHDERLGERVLELSGDCRVHNETLALVLALLLEHGPPPPDPKRELEQEEPEPEEEESEPTEPRASEPQEAQEAPAVEAAPQPVRLHASGGLRVVQGWLPAVSLGPTFLVGARIHESWSIEVLGDYYPVSDSSLDVGGGVRMGGGRAHIRGCALLGRGAMQFPLCLGTGWMGLSASGQGVEVAQTALLSTPEVSGELAVAWSVNDRLALLLEASALVPLKKGSFVFLRADDSLQVHETQAVLPSGSVGLRLTF